MSVDRIRWSRFKRADVTTGAVGSGDTSLISRGTSGQVSRIDCQAAGKERDRRGRTAVIPKRAKLGVGAIQTACCGKVATGVGSDVVTGIGKGAKAVTSDRLLARIVLTAVAAAPVAT